MRKQHRLLWCIVLPFGLPTASGCERGTAPDAPTAPVGDEEWQVHIPYTASAIPEDPDGDRVSIRFDWADGEISEWSEPVDSGTTVEANHVWTEPGVFAVRAQSRDVDDRSSEWSVEMPVRVWMAWEFTLPGWGNSVRQTPDGGYIVAGSAEGSALLLKVDASGVSEWKHIWRGIGEDTFASVGLTEDGGYIMAGSTNSWNAERQMYIVKTGVNGAWEWDEVRGYSDSADWANAIQQTADGGYIAVGTTETSTGSRVYMLKLGPAGGVEWYQTKGYAGDHNIGASILQTPDGGYVVAGLTGSNIFFFKTDSSGVNNQFVFKKDYGFAYAWASDVQPTGDGGFIIVGTIADDASDRGILLVKTDAAGNDSWYTALEYNDDEWNEGYSVQQTTDGGYIVAGSMSNNGLMLKTNASGEQEWRSLLFLGMGFYGCQWREVRQTADGGYVVVGGCFGPGGSEVLFMRKTDAYGRVLF